MLESGPANKRIPCLRAAYSPADTLPAPADGSAFGYFLLSSNGMDIVPTSDRLSWRVIGGVVDLFLLTGPTPAAVMDQLTQVVGRPAMPPEWALGWHQVGVVLLSYIYIYL